MNRYHITPAEWTLMRVLWKSAPLSATEVFEAVGADVNWHPKTVRTLLGRLVKKGVLHREKRGGVFRFSAKLPEEDCVGEESRSFLERCFGGALQPMLAHFIEHEDVDAETLAALQTILDERRKQGKPK